MSEANNAFLSGSRIAAGNGLWPRQHRIEKDSILYRFADTSYREPSQAADGPWWFEFDHFQTIKQGAAGIDYGTARAIAGE